jgi:hypothetical protein
LKGCAKGVAWLVCVFVLLAVAVRRADNLGTRDFAFKQGYAIGTIIVSLGAAFSLWFFVQHAIRKRRGYPPWIGVIAIGVCLLVTLPDMGKQAVAQGPGHVGCKPAAQPFGAAPAGWSYEQPSADVRTALMRSTELDKMEPRTVVRIAARPGRRGAVLFAIPDAGDNFMQGWERSSRRLGETVRHARFGRTPVTVIVPRSGKTYSVIGAPECVGILVLGPLPETTEAIARAILSR